MRLRIERVHGASVEFVCRNATALIPVGSKGVAPAVMMRVEASEVGLTQSEHLSLVLLKL
jgi:hypothetical protein